MEANTTSSQVPEKIEIFKTLNSKPRLQALLYLFIYRKLNLTELSKFLGKTKNTTVYHMKLMANQGLILESDQIIEGSIKPLKNYELSADFYKTVFMDFGDLANLPESQIIGYSRNIFRWNTLLFETVRELMREISLFSETSEKSIKSSQDALQFHTNPSNHIPRDLIPLSENGYKEYMKLYQDFKEKTLALIEKEELKENIARPYLAFNMVLPIKTLVELRHTKGKKGKKS
ncbi:hypothetical protein NEF87_003683 [Candidatus Lokiarchaeum ossiferum]|uniref:HTH arsR-type domain-containing protein n=1 Tax=Candidatus Lokiarchaeum ossiferum TaxID=2951803 RepID=A0ABY6HV53_9ARCH|nr:hypothetical protein NEF87_003683 [Candidatus Lokiarchaeum sp. B-35]